MTFTRPPATCDPWLLYIFLCSGENPDLEVTEVLLLAFSLSLPPGKTAAFALPVLERLIYKPRQAPVTRVLVLVPTRELGIQVHSVTKQLAQFCNITTCLAVGECLAEGCQPLRDYDVVEDGYAPPSEGGGYHENLFNWIHLKTGWCVFIADSSGSDWDLTRLVEWNFKIIGKSFLGPK